MKWVEVIVSFILTLSFLSFPSCGFQSDELLVDDEEFGLEGAPQHRSPEPIPTRSPPVTSPTRKRHSDLDSDSKIQFSLDHAFGDSDFSPAGTFSARLKTWSHGGQNLLESDDFYRIRLPSNVLSPPGRDFIISSVKARCLPRESLDEHFVIHMEGVNVLAVNYGSPGSCPYPRNLKLPAKWSFSSHTVLKNSEQAPRAPVFTEEILGGENAEGEVVQPAERSFWAKYWMYLIPLGLIVMNAITQAMNMPEEQATGQVPAQGQPSAGAVQRGPSSAVRRR
ncbi:ER membrane protein complex subunit 10 isoform X2 [Gossypium hirsutum]|uniref:ER membrane protein complex subunit 10 n=1 Tax=Gossypium hirsutum TaxID=3635 RepID=A0A1U8NWW5_GOSHI|nr:ER membrane protein complex subunit 10 isoform X2 [Gossypium hirsutum]